MGCPRSTWAQGSAPPLFFLTLGTGARAYCIYTLSLLKDFFYLRLLCLHMCVHVRVCVSVRARVCMCVACAHPAPFSSGEEKEV